MTTANRDISCKSRWTGHKTKRMSDIRKLWAAEQEMGGDAHVSDLGSLNEYGLSFDYVVPGTFNDQPRGYWRWQLSWGGPSDEIRFYAELLKEYGPAYVDRIEYVFMDWYDGHTRALRGKDRDLMETIFKDWLTEVGTTWHVRAKAIEAA